MQCILTAAVLLACVFTLTQGLTEREYYVLKYNLQLAIRNTSSFSIKKNDAGNYEITIRGFPEHQLGQCYNTELGCCRPNVRTCYLAKTFEVPGSPVARSNVTYCTPNGPVGVAVSGTVFYNHLEAGCLDVNQMPDGSFDECNGHPAPNGEYHFHRAPNPECLGIKKSHIPQLIGVALDGFPIYDSPMYRGVKQNLDQCGGFMPMNDPKRYRYVSDYHGSSGSDHVVPCFKGIPISPQCCQCLECGLTQLPNCNAGRPGAQQGGPRPRPPQQGGFQPRPPQQGSTGQFGRPGQGRPSGPPRCVGEAPQRRSFNFFNLYNREPEREGFCNRNQLNALRARERQLANQPRDCRQCTTSCVPKGGFQTIAASRQYQQCKRCAPSQGSSSNTRQQPRRIADPFAGITSQLGRYSSFLGGNTGSSGVLSQFRGFSSQISSINQLLSGNVQSTLQLLGGNGLSSFGKKK